MKTLIAYFSHAGENYFPDGYKNVDVGNAEIIANKAKELLGADIFKIDTIKKYSDNYEQCCNEAKEEQRKGELPELKEYLSSIEMYERIVLIYPCWWGTMPQAVFTFLQHYNFSGKEIFPICTHEGSGMGRSESDIAHVCKNADLVQGLAVYGHKAKQCNEELKRFFKIK